MVANDGETDMKHFVFKSKIRGFLAGLVFRYADLVITQNNYQSRNLSRYKIRPFVIKSSDIIGEPNDDNDSYALWVGRADSLKQPSIFLELARKNQENDFVMICPPSTHNPKLSDYIRHEAMDIGNLRFIPFVSFHQIDKYFQNAKIFVNTSSQEGFPHTFVQAAKNKAPILSLNVNPDNFIDEYNCGFCSRNDFQLMNRQFRQLYGDNELYNTMSLNVLRYAKLNHDNIINAGKLNKLIRSIT